MRFTWDEAKRKVNLKEHGLDFVDAESVFAGPTYTFEDDRFNYGEQRFSTLGLLKGVPVSIVHTESTDAIRVISFRKATTHETEIFFSKISDELPTPPDDEGRRRKNHRRAPRGKPKAHRRRNRKARS